MTNASSNLPLRQTPHSDQAAWGKVRLDLDSKRRAGLTSVLEHLPPGLAKDLRARLNRDGGRRNIKIIMTQIEAEEFVKVLHGIAADGTAWPSEVAVRVEMSLSFTSLGP